ncbi:hypothetical protein V8C43DRAFT_250225 [Trichoderma afarasin]
MATWEAGAPLRVEESVRDKSESGSAPTERNRERAGDEKRRRTESQTAKNRAKEKAESKKAQVEEAGEAEAKEARSKKAMGEEGRDASGRGRLAQQAWKWSSWFSGTPPVQSPLSATHSRHFLRGSPARCGPVGTGRLQGPGLVLAGGRSTLRSTRAAAEGEVPQPEPSS